MDLVQCYRLSQPAELLTSKAFRNVDKTCSLIKSNWELRFWVINLSMDRRSENAFRRAQKNHKQLTEMENAVKSFPPAEFPSSIFIMKIFAESRRGENIFVSIQREEKRRNFSHPREISFDASSWEHSALLSLYCFSTRLVILDLR